MSRFLSLDRRRANLVSLTLRAPAGIASYNFYSLPNFDGSPTLMANVPAGTGLRSKNIALRNSASGYVEDGSSRYRGVTQFVFDPADYTLTDTIPMWIQTKSIDTAGNVAASFTAPHLVMPYNSNPNRMIIIAGNAPNVVAASALEIQLPMQCQNITIKNNHASTAMFVSFEPGGVEFDIPTNAGTGYEFKAVFPSITQMFVRGNGVVAPFDAILSQRDNPIE